MNRAACLAGAVLALGLSSQVTQAQVLQQPSPSRSGHGHMVRDSSGNVILSAVYTASVTKFRASDGALLWDASVASSYGQMAIDSSNNVYVSGTQPGTDSQGNVVSMLILTKISPTGTVLWSSRRNIGLVSEHSSAGPVAVGTNGSVYVIGTAGNSSQSTAPATLVRFATSNGGVQSTLALGNVVDFGADMPSHALRLDGSNNVYWASPAGLKRFTSTLGSSATWPGQRPVRGIGFSGTSVYITGTQSTGSGYQMYVAKLASSGLTTTWKFVFPAQPRTNPYPNVEDVCVSENFTTYGGNALTVDSSGNVYAAGTAVSMDQSFTGGMFAKLNPSGQLLWTRQFGYSGLEASCFDTAIDPNGELVVSCTDMQFDNASSTALAAIYDQNGNQLAFFSNDGPGGVSDAFDHLLIGTSGTLFLLDESGYWTDSTATSQYFVPSIFVYQQTGL